MKGLKGLYKRLDSISRADGKDSAWFNDAVKEMRQTMTHCHVFGLDLVELCRSGIYDKLSEYFLF